MKAYLSEIIHTTERLVKDRAIAWKELNMYIRWS